MLQQNDRRIIGDCTTLGDIQGMIADLPRLDLVIASTDSADAAAIFADIHRMRALLPGARWILLSRHASVDFVRDAICAGIDGMLLEDSPAEALRLLTDLVLLGHSFLSAEPARPPDSLSEREQDILRCVSEGQSNKRIARELGITESTVKVHVKALLRKMDVANRTQAAIRAQRYLRRADTPVAPAETTPFQAAAGPQPGAVPMSGL
jgi:two-component system nitrate/nitrite response regulator NarL